MIKPPVKAIRGVRVRIALGDPDCPAVALRGREEGIGDAMASKVRNALTLYRPLPGTEHIEIRLHEAILYNSIYCADGQVFVNQHIYSIPAARSPVYSGSRFDGRDDYLRLDNTHLTPREVAEQVMGHFGLHVVSGAKRT